MKAVLETERVILRQLTLNDSDALIALDSDPEVTRYFTSAPTPDEIRRRILPEKIADYARHPGFGFFAAVDKVTGNFMGWFHLRPYQGDPERGEIGYRIKRVYWGQGLATEVSRALVLRAFDSLGVRRVIAETVPDNAASIRVMEKVGLRFDRTLKDGQVVVYALDRHDWQRP